MASLVPQSGLRARIRLSSLRRYVHGGLVCFGSWALLGGCHEAPRSAQLPSQPPHLATTPRAPAASLPAFIPPPAPALGQRGYHRYVGTVTGRPVVVELSVDLAYPTAQYFDCEGTYYYLDSGQPHVLRTADLWQPTQPLELLAEGVPWCFTQALGPTLSGSCTTRHGQPLGVVSLHESYARAAHYELLTETLHEGVGTRLTGGQDTSSITRSYLHLLGRDTLRPALARLQCPAPTQRLRGRRQVLAANFTPSGEDTPLVVWLQEDRFVTLNEADLLAYYVEENATYGGVGRGHLSHQNYLVDLRTGQPLRLVKQLRPGGLLQLRRLLTQHAQRDTTAHVLDDYLQGPLLRLPPEDFLLQPAGCNAYYGAKGSHDGSYSSFQETISWAELRPLLRPQSPLWRLLQARGRYPTPAVGKRLVAGWH